MLARVKDTDAGNQTFIGNFFTDWTKNMDAPLERRKIRYFLWFHTDIWCHLREKEKEKIISVISHRYMDVPWLMQVLIHTTIFLVCTGTRAPTLCTLGQPIIDSLHGFTIVTGQLIDLVEVMLFDYLQWYTQDFENEISSAFFWLLNVTWNFSSP